jgi:hypothetical protein
VITAKLQLWNQLSQLAHARAAMAPTASSRYRSKREQYMVVYLRPFSVQCTAPIIPRGPSVRKLYAHNGSALAAKQVGTRAVWGGRLT